MGVWRRLSRPPPRFSSVAAAASRPFGKAPSPGCTERVGERVALRPPSPSQLSASLLRGQGLQVPSGTARRRRLQLPTGRSRGPRPRGGSSQAAPRAAPSTSGSSRGPASFERLWRAGNPAPAAAAAAAPAGTMASASAAAGAPAPPPPPPPSLPSLPGPGNARSPASLERDRLWRVLGWRIATSVVWSVLLLPVCTGAFVFFSSLDVLHPVQWVSDALHDLYGSCVLSSLLLLSALVIVISVFNIEFYTVVPSIPCSRLALIGKIVHPQQVMHSLVHSAMGMLMAWCAAVMTKDRYHVLAVPCTDADSLESKAARACLNEHHLFLLLAGAFMGYSYSLLYFVNNMNYLPFPIIQQYKFLRFRRALPLLLRHSAVESLYLLRNFCFLYYFLGYIPKAWVSTAMDLQKDEKQPPLDSLSGLFDLSLLYHVWLCGVFLLVTWYTTWVLFRIYATEAHAFPVQPMFTGDVEECLPRVLNDNTPLIIKYLALQDLMLLSQYSPSRRQEVFSLSQPGGHPHNWVAISRECLALLNDLTQRLVMYQEAAATNGRVKPPSSPVEPKKPIVMEETAFQTPKASLMPKALMPSLVKASLFSPKFASPDTLNPVCSPYGDSVSNRAVGIVDIKSPRHEGPQSLQSPQLTRRGPRLWTSLTDPQSNGPRSPHASPPPIRREAQHKGRGPPWKLCLWLQNKQEQVKSFLAKRVLIVYFFSKHPEASIQAVFSDAQMHIWALEGLSHLVAASFTEDRFGVVQTTLPTILSTLLTLQEAVDKHFKLPHVSSRPPRISGSLVDTSYKTLRFALRASLKTAIYRITTTFGEHLNAVQASAEHQKRLQQFLEFKE
ncbi:nucleoporin NDC1 isoform X2 [Sarcophilus harrisii]|uniref:nucleoporin NDC1 isoform X2 n=1 Tax=Sarcophilus harrisii TaxID=9305 RepID=UPI001301AA45|nr:nucleoporin NDC1 isoform X2 [Sarcophilus harrisii]